MDTVEICSEESTKEESRIPDDPLNACNLFHTSCRSYSDVPPSAKDQIMFLGYPSWGDIFARYGYVILFNKERYVPDWVCECLTHYQMSKNHLSRRNKPDFEVDPDVKELTLADYPKYEGIPMYEKGHLAAAGNHRYNLNAYNSTFLLTNIAPMFHNVNEAIMTIEDQARSFANNQSIEQVYIITGTVFYKDRIPIYVSKGSRVQVPNAFFKVLAVEEKLNQYRVYSYLIENVPGVEYKTLKREISLDYINSVTGLKILIGMHKGPRGIYMTTITPRCRGT